MFSILKKLKAFVYLLLEVIWIYPFITIESYYKIGYFVYNISNKQNYDLL